MKVKQIINNLDHIKTHTCQGKERKIIGIEKYSKENNYFLPNIIYYSNKEVKSTTNDKYNNFIIEEKNLSEKIKKSNIENLIVIENQKLNYFVESVQEKINKDNFLTHVRKTLYEKVMKNADIKIILKNAYKFLNNPIVVADSTYRLLACYPQKYLGDPVWDKLFEQGFVNQKHMRKFDVDKTLEELLKSDKPILLNWGFAEKIPRLSIKIQNNNNLVATIGVLEYNRDIINQDYEVIKILSEILLLVIKQNNQPSDRLHILKQSLLANLLDGGITSKKFLEETMNNVNLKMIPPYYLLSCPLTNIDNNQLENIHNDLTLKIDNIQILTHKDNFILFLYGEKLKSKLKTLKDIFEKYNISFGISNKYSNLLNSSGYYQQAAKTLKLGQNLNENKYIYQFQDYAEECLIENDFSNQNFTTFIHPEVKKLIKYDNKNDTKFAETLYNFLKNYKKTNKAAESLHIHRNTLSYRLNKCQEIAKLDLSDNNECRYIQLSLKISELKELKFD